MRYLRATAITTALMSLAAATAATAAASVGARHAGCGHGYSISYHGIGAAVVVQKRDIRCSTVNTLGNGLLRGVVQIGPHHAARLDGYLCRNDNVNAGGGAITCTRRRSLVRFDFE